MARRVLFLSSGRLTVYHRQGSTFAPPLHFRADEHGIHQFSQYLQQAGPSPVAMVVDVVEEEFREETIPHVFGKDRQALISNKQTRLFRDPTFCHAIPHGREEGGRRDDKVLFTAVIRPDLLTPWLSQISRYKIPLSGIYSLPLLSVQLLKKLKVDSSHVLLVTLNSSGGLRQTFLQNKQVKVSRLAVMPDVGASRYASYILSEVEKIRRYLGSLRLLSRETPLDVYIISHGVILEDLTRQSIDSVNSRHHLLNMTDVCKALRIKPPVDGPYSDLLFSRLLVSNPPKNHYAPAQERRYFSMRRARVAMVAAGLLLLVGSLAWSAFKTVESILVTQQTTVLARQTSFYDDRLRIARERMPETPARPQDMEKAVKMAEQVSAYRSSPVKMMLVLSAGLSVFPDLHIDEIEWKSTADAEAAISGQGGTQDSRRDRRKRKQAPTGELYHIAHINGRIEPFSGDYRRALERIDRLRDILLRQPAVESVTALSLPINTQSNWKMLGSAAGADTPKEANFELRVVIKVKEPKAA